MTTSEPMSFSAIVLAASASRSSGVMVKSVLPLTRRMSLTFIVLLLWGLNLGYLGGRAVFEYSPQSTPT